MENPDQPVNGLEEKSPFGTGEHRFAALREKCTREGNPCVNTKSSNRSGSQKYGGQRGTDAGAPLTSGDKRHGKQDSELRLIGEAPDENAGEHGPSFEKQQRSPKQGRCQKSILSDEKIPSRKWGRQHQRNCRLPPDNQIDDSDGPCQRRGIPTQEGGNVRKHCHRHQDEGECGRI
jgi:hypothetical protein